jgi:hypothetical protein
VGWTHEGPNADERAGEGNYWHRARKGKLNSCPFVGTDMYICWKDKPGRKIDNRPGHESGQRFMCRYINSCPEVNTTERGG